MSTSRPYFGTILLLLSLATACGGGTKDAATKAVETPLPICSDQPPMRAATRAALVQATARLRASPKNLDVQDNWWRALGDYSGALYFDVGCENVPLTPAQAEDDAVLKSFGGLGGCLNIHVLAACRGGILARDIDPGTATFRATAP